MGSDILVVIAHSAKKRLTGQDQLQMRADETSRVVVICKRVEPVIRGVDGEAHLSAGCRDEIDNAVSAGRVDDTGGCEHCFWCETRTYSAQVIIIRGKEVAYDEVIKRRAIFKPPNPVFQRDQTVAPAFSSRNGMKLPYSPLKNSSGWSARAMSSSQTRPSTMK